MNANEMIKNLTNEGRIFWQPTQLLPTWRQLSAASTKNGQPSQALTWIEKGIQLHNTYQAAKISATKAAC